ncbi:MAG: outer membrane lipoprotein-sorting protein [Thermodesulfobacteriota bacterium]|nr:outer membrane lipoprotein-sorting protein [Thermodesulfobacteriota bacterium]
MRKLFLLLTVPAIILWIGFSSTGSSDEASFVREIVKKVDRLYRSQSSEAELEMEIVTPNWERQLRLKMWTEGLHKTFIHILSPKKDAGITTLRIGTSMWNYFPKINKVIKVPPSMMMASWMGSDFTNDDLVKESSLLEDYNAVFVPARDMLNYYFIELIPKKKTPTVWGKIILVLRKKDIIPVRQVFYDEKGEEVRVMNFSDIRKFGKRKIPATLELVPLKHTGRKTVLRYIDARFDTEIDDSIFTRRNLQKKR